jgi:molybdopterin-guanine dinucleotide biosynthesis protein A
MINANRNAAAYAAFSPWVVPTGWRIRRPPGRPGCRPARRHWKDWVLTCPCDSPFLPLDLAPACSRCPGSAAADLAMASATTARTGLLAHRRLAPGLAPPFWKAAGGRSGGRGSVVVDFSDCGAFSNINTRTGPPDPEHRRAA